ncbi:class I SAM-dependent methyltransferase [Halopseudomonas sp.]|uniref:class I SAM-dependent methyltransferase n=1 Tax=Halopseudomonas sp. TaxID=2901191 RepID=UPI003001F90A
MMARQVKDGHYQFGRYMSRGRWMSVWHQVSELLALDPKAVLEVGPGPGVLKSVINGFGCRLETLDIDEALCPDYLASAEEMPFNNGSFDVVCAFQVLEHMPFDVSLSVLREMWRVCSGGVVISLPDARPCWSSSVRIPYVRPLNIMFERPFFRGDVHVFDGEHYWEINKKGYALSDVSSLLLNCVPGAAMSTYRVRENPYHRFFVFKK